jgi:DNA-directed RNA polymerase subunit RPC12/RpoP
MKDVFMKAFGGLAVAQGELAGWSEEFKKFYSSGYRCPGCNERLLTTFGVITVDFYSKNGNKIPLWKLVVYKADFAECPKCRHRWPVKGTGYVETPAKLEILGIRETDREEEEIGTDKRVIDNSMSSVGSKRKFTVSKQWAKSYSVEYEKTQTENSGISVGLEDIGIKASLEETIRKQFAISEETREVYSEEVEINIPGSTKLNVFFHWKKIWQHGYVKFKNQEGELSEVPFRVAIGVTFDQLQVDEKTGT